jgi:hypothetical protein
VTPCVEFLHFGILALVFPGFAQKLLSQFEIAIKETEFTGQDDGVRSPLAAVAVRYFICEAHCPVRVALAVNAFGPIPPQPKTPQFQKPRHLKCWRI